MQKKNFCFLIIILVTAVNLILKEKAVRVYLGSTCKAIHFGLVVIGLKGRGGPVLPPPGAGGMTSTGVMKAAHQRLDATAI